MHCTQKCAFFGSCYVRYITMHGSKNVKIANAQRAKQTYQYKKIKG